MFSTTIGVGDVYAHRIAGGGGYGDPLERDPDPVALDVANGKVSSEAARGAVRRRVGATARSTGTRRAPAGGRGEST